MEGLLLYYALKFDIMKNGNFRKKEDGNIYETNIEKQISGRIPGKFTV